MKQTTESPQKISSQMKAPSLKYRVRLLIPGLIYSAAIAGLALLIYFTSNLSLLNPLLTAVLIGIVARNTIGIPSHCQPGIAFSMKRILRLAVILLGLKLSLSQILEVGFSGLMIVSVSSISTFYLTCWLGEKLKINHRLTHLIAAGTSICGASAVVATNAVVESSEEDVTYAIALITSLGTLAMLSYPLLADLLQLSSSTFGIWCGASIHEVAQVVAAGFQKSTASGEIATITKLSRVLLIIPIIAVLSYQKTDHRLANIHPDKTIPFPWFVLFFGIVIIFNSIDVFPAWAKTFLLIINQFLLCLSMAAMGLMTRLTSLSRIGIKPLYLASISWLFLGSLSLLLIKLSL